MKAVVGCLFVVLLASPSMSDMAGECEMAFFYLELGCTMETGEGSTKLGGVVCPHAFSCPKMSPDDAKSTKCYYRGVGYPGGTVLPEAVIKNPCSRGCSCAVSEGVPSFTCAAVDCVEFYEEELKGECVKQYSLDSCCSQNKVCGKDAIAALKTCEMEGKIYKEGQTFNPENTKKTCLCTDKWNGTSDGEDCQDINCGLEIHYQDMLFKKCAPVFYKKGISSCPITFHCPSDDMKIIKGLNVRGVNAQCAFGNQTLSVGDAVDFKDCTRCECNVPPFLNCYEKSTTDCSTS